MKIWISAILLSLVLINYSYANDTGYHLGVSYLNSEHEFMGEDDNDSGLEVRFGYSLNKNIFFEASYLDLGTVELPSNPDAGGAFDNDGYSLSAIGVYPVGDFNLIGKVGYLWWESEGSLGSIAGPIGYSSSGYDLLLGVGLSFNVNDRFELKIDYNDSQEFNWVSIGFNYHF